MSTRPHSVIGTTPSTQEVPAAGVPAAGARAPDVPVAGVPGAPGAPAGGARCWRLRKNCSLSPRQVAAFYASLTLLSFGFAAYFSWRGLWLVWPFAAAENLLLAGALLHYARHALDHECVCLEGDVLTVAVASGRTVTRHVFNAAWARLEWRGRRSETLWLCEGAHAMPLGVWLTPPARRAFAGELRQAMRQRAAR